MTAISKDTVMYLKNPWSNAVSTMTWGEVIAWAQNHIHPSNRRNWLAHARRAVRREDAEMLGQMIIGS